jgi:GDPmannose 4,6-dehydratase
MCVSRLAEHGWAGEKEVSRSKYIIIMVVADLELAGLESLGEETRIIENHHGNWHRWDSQVVSID